MKIVDPLIKVPLYHQLYEILQAKITKGELNPGDVFPTELELSKQYHVSRITVRKVLDLLVREGLVFRKQGKGTFVAHPRLEHGLSRIVNFTEDMLQRGLKPGTRKIKAALIAADEYVAKKLKIQAGDELVLLERLRLADGEPMCLEKSMLIHKYCPGILKHDFEKNSLRHVKESEYGIRWIRARQTIQAKNADKEIAALLKIPVRAALLFIERISYSQQNIPIEFLRAYYRADRYTLYNELQGGAG
ncbi:GntR family transcriptional regulator [candidate division KSB1 bacterium]|nr:GntR family transcriptional regulator [candidate division KSB1 bacterium]